MSIKEASYYFFNRTNNYITNQIQSLIKAKIQKMIETNAFGRIFNEKNTLVLQQPAKAIQLSVYTSLHSCKHHTWNNMADHVWKITAVSILCKNNQTVSGINEKIVSSHN